MDRGARHTARDARLWTATQSDGWCNVFAFELNQAAGRLQSPNRRAAHEPIEDDYSEESQPDDALIRDALWSSRELLAVDQMRREARRWAKCPHREFECAAPNA